ncbi:MAG: helix-turn-helix transcriptional regulator [Chloracidobacterium sp.]|nr:helix-turn-helix transcriptional regulator [Chloracidobacterium sp.]
MTGQQLHQHRKRSGLTQKQAARYLRVSQPYLSLLENGDRPLTPVLKRRAVKTFNLSVTELPSLAAQYKVAPVTDDQLTTDLATLGYPGFAYLKPSRQKNPTDVLLSGLNSDKRAARLVEALPWLLFSFPDLDWNALVMTAKAHDLQNRLGFVTNVAKRMAKRYGKAAAAEKLATVEDKLAASKLEKKATLCNETMTQAERNWLAQNSTKEAKHWHLLTDLSPDHLDHYADN